MVPNGTAYSNYPPFANNGTKTPPGGSPESAKYALGMVPADTFPAEWANYLFHGATAGITRLNTDVGSIKKEINSVLEAFGITNDASVFNQLLGALNKIYAKFTSCDTAAITETKLIAVQGDVLKAGNVYVIDMTNGNTFGDGSTTYPKLSVNSGTAYPLCDANGHYLANGAWAAGDTIKVIFTGSKFLMATRAVTDSITSGDKSPVTSDAVYRQFNVLHPIGETYTQYPAQKSPNELWGNFSTWTELKYGGAFFRGTGGHAQTFDTELEVAIVSGYQVDFTAAHNLEVGSLLYDADHNETRRVATIVSTTSVTIDSLFTRGDEVESLYVGQPASVPNITGMFRATSAKSDATSGAFTCNKNYTSNWRETGSGVAQWEFNASNSGASTDANGNNIYADNAELKSENFTVKVWVRTA